MTPITPCLHRRRGISLWQERPSHRRCTVRSVLLIIAGIPFGQSADILRLIGLDKAVAVALLATRNGAAQSYDV